MARATYAIRHGFEYQDLYCAYQLLQHMMSNELDIRFDIESDQALHVDDLVIRPTAGAVEGHQVKFHVDQNHVESFESLTDRRTGKSTSLLQKLFRGWNSLTQAGSAQAMITFISSNPAERGRYKLGPVIDTRTGRFNDKFFDHADYAKWRAEFLRHLKTDDNELQ